MRPPEWNGQEAWGHPLQNGIWQRPVGVGHTHWNRNEPKPNEEWEVGCYPPGVHGLGLWRMVNGGWSPGGCGPVAGSVMGDREVMRSISLHAGIVRLGTTLPMSSLPQLATVNSLSAPISFPALAAGLLGQKESDPPPPTTVTKKGVLESGGSTEWLFMVEGIRPVPKILAEKARAWQYINLVELLPSKPYCVEDKWSLLQQAQADGQVVLVQSMQQLKSSKRDIADILS